MSDTLTDPDAGRDLRGRLGRLPTWTRAWLADATVRESQGDRILDAGPVALITIRRERAGLLTPDEFELVASGAYSRLRERLASLHASHPVRLWNFIPRIHTPCGRDDLAGDVTRYMVFNAGRYRGYIERFFGAEEFPAAMPTATGVGHEGDDLVLHCLAMHAPGEPVENPRQIPAYAYSRKFGALPPCFSRATSVLRGDRRFLLIGGTASVRGEASMHEGSLDRQLDETLANLRELLTVWSAPASSPRPGHVALSHARAYYPRHADLAVIEPRLREGLPGATLEFIRADLCRRELLVEIEGLAETAHD